MFSCEISSDVLTADYMSVKTENLPSNFDEMQIFAAYPTSLSDPQLTFRISP